MTNEELIAKIKAEIERRREANKRQYHSSAGGMSWQRMCGEEDCLVELLSFLSTLESEKPMNQELEAEIDKYREEHLFDMPAFQQVARHFAEWGAEHLKK